jgi:hypothetical protein
MHSNEDALRNAQHESLALEAGLRISDSQDILFVLKDAANRVRAETPKVTYFSYAVMLFKGRHIGVLSTSFG